jgi:YegS/Rv2252/BmrU family lipid kinase
MEAAVVINLSSSQSSSRVEAIPGMLEARGIRVVEFHSAGDHAALRRYFDQAVKRKAKTLIVGGGDGSMAQAANALAHSETVLGVLPLGTGNSFAATIGLDGQLESAIEVIANGRVASVDLGRVNGRYFANFATIGLPAEIAKSSPNNLKRFLGPLAYVFAGIRPMLTHKPFRAKVRWDRGGRMILQTQQIVIASGRFFGKQPVLPSASITSGRLAFFTTSGVSHLDLVRTYLAFALGLQTKLGDAHAFSAESIEVRAKPKQPLNIDGEPLGKTPARFCIARRALRVLVPSDFVDDGG